MSDYEIDLPEGQILIEITDPRMEPEKMAELKVERRGDRITGVPATRENYPLAAHWKPKT